MNIAFYAPLKSPKHPRPSGDRAIARLFFEAFQQAGHDVELVSEFRSRESRGDVDHQRRLRNLGERLAVRLIRQLQKRPRAARPDVWFTYHLYYKAPDWLGPTVARALGIPYVVAEASFAPKRDRPPWQMVHRAVGNVIGHADAIVALNSDDIPCLLPLLGGSRERVHHVAPFMDTRTFAANSGDRMRQREQLAAQLQIDAGVPWLVTVAMMRDGDKLASYQMLGDALTQVAANSSGMWQLLVVGDGEVRPQVAAALAPLGARAKYLGQLQPDTLAPVLGAADIYVWPAVNEAFGMAFLEAQACGLPVVAAATRGVPDVVADRQTGLLTELSASAIAVGVRALLDDDALRHRLAANAASYVHSRHDVRAAGKQLNQILTSLTCSQDRP